MQRLPVARVKSTVGDSFLPNNQSVLGNINLVH